MNELRWGAVVLAVMAIGCGGRDGSGSRRDAGGASDAGAGDDGGLARDGGGGGGDGGAESDGGGGGGDDAGSGSLCGPTGTWECGPVMCHGRMDCLTRDLDRLGYAGFTECGTERAVTEADSRAACEVGPPFGSWPREFRCTEASFSGTLRFFCAPDGRSVLTRYQMLGTMPPAMGTTTWTSYGYDFYEGSGGGTGGSHIHLDDTSLGLGSVAVVGYHLTMLPASGSIASTIWFTVDPYFGGKSGPFIGGGYQVSLGAGGPE